MMNYPHPFISQRDIGRRRAVFAFILALSALGSPTLAAQDGELQALFARAEAHNASLSAARAALAVAEDEVRAARAERLPDVDVALNLSYLGDATLTRRNFSHAERAAMPHYGNSFALEASQALYTGGALTAGVEMARLGSQQARAALDAERQRVRLLIVGHYLDLCQLNNEARVYAEHIDLAERLVAQVRSRQSAGTALPADLTRYELRLEQLRLALRRVVDRRVVAARRLATCVGGDVDSTLLPEAFRVDTAAITASLATDASPLLRQAHLATDQARQQVRLEQAQRRPTLALVAASHLDGPITIEVPPIDRNLHYWYVGVGVRYNLSALYKGRSRLSAARRAVVEHEEQCRVVAEQLADDMVADYVDYRQRLAEWRTHLKNAQLAAENYDVVEQRYLADLVLVTDMVDAAATRLEADLQAANAETRIAYAYYKMRYTAGRL